MFNHLFTVSNSCDLHQSRTQVEPPHGWIDSSYPFRPSSLSLGLAQRPTQHLSLRVVAALSSHVAPNAKVWMLYHLGSTSSLSRYTEHRTKTSVGAHRREKQAWGRTQGKQSHSVIHWVEALAHTHTRKYISTQKSGGDDKKENTKSDNQTVQLWTPKRGMRAWHKHSNQEKFIEYVRCFNVGPSPPSKKKRNETEEGRPPPPREIIS